MSRANPLNRSVDALVRALPRPRTTGDLLAEAERKLALTRRLLIATTFAAGLMSGIWLALIITR